MNSKNIYFIIAGILNLFTFFLHLIGGQIDLVNPMLNSSLNIEKTSQLLGAWHMVTLILAASSFVLLTAGLGKRYASNKEIIQFVGILNLSFCLPFLVGGLYYGLLVPQWILFLPIGLLTFAGINKNNKSKII